ncbi:hypothetical protein ACJZ2D_006608 [Fusarium nematophilum]
MSEGSGSRQDSSAIAARDQPYGYPRSAIRSINSRNSGQGTRQYNTTPIPFALPQKTTPTPNAPRRQACW